LKTSLKATRNVSLRRRGARYYLKRDALIYLIMLPGLLYFLLFKYLPMFGILIAFKDYKPALGIPGIFSSNWVGLKWFRRFFGSAFAPRLISNTFLISFLDLLFVFPAPIVLALMLNEVKSTRFKRTIQTISYLPHFLSSVIVVGMLRQLLSVEGGLINTILGALGRDPIYFLGSSRWYRTYYTASSWWSTVGWSSIIYLASITGIDPSWYEAAEIDGANVFHKMWHVTIPSILPIIAIMLIFRIGQLLNVGYEKTLLLYSEMVYDVADIISTYVYREGIVNMKYSYTAAVDLFTSVVSLFLVLGSNYVVKKMGQEGIW
jgi:putative aldouronate transport system permease protein